jgi:hypothetical protein
MKPTEEECPVAEVRDPPKAGTLVAEIREIANGWLLIRRNPNSGLRMTEAFTIPDDEPDQGPGEMETKRTLLSELAHELGRGNPFGPCCLYVELRPGDEHIDADGSNGCEVNGDDGT